ncbi:MAG: hypothetical protein KGS09_01925 [Nitrospirae bacterium]|nr:hypothetical protein [Nitrospirota bacterium]MBU6479287.1 hypothetical protein [Nitrospirota bacterium]MDE3219851.1 hypothetical protein [Nitrospirota bacterium]
MDEILGNKPPFAAVFWSNSRTNRFFSNPDTQPTELPLRINEFYRTLLSGYPAGLTIASHS